MKKFTTIRIIALLFLLGAAGYSSEIFGEPAGKDAGGEVYIWGLTATYTGPDELLPGEGKFKKLFKFLPSIRWYDPAHYFQPREIIEGQFAGPECVLCHTVQTPGIVKDWKRSKHSKPGKTKSMKTEQIVACDACHGNDHNKLTMPDVNVCGKCHMEKVVEHKAGGHGRAFHRDVVENAGLIDKPAEEAHSCVVCHGTIENRCDGCHTRHRFNPAEARRSENCGVCHTGTDQYDYETWMNSYHGKIYKTEGDEWDWNLRLKDWSKVGKEGQMPAPRTPTCAYCHMPKGVHNVGQTITADTDKGKSLVDRGAEKYKAKRKKWLKTCKKCHSTRFANDQLNAMDEVVNMSFVKVREAFNIVNDLQKEGLIDPTPEGLAPDWKGHTTFSLNPEGQDRLYNVSKIERMAMDMLAVHSTAIYKGAAHFSMADMTYNNGAFSMDRALINIKDEASKLRRIARLESKQDIKHIPYDFWKNGEFTNLLKGKKRIEGAVLEKKECLHGDTTDCRE